MGIPVDLSAHIGSGDDRAPAQSVPLVLAALSVYAAATAAGSGVVSGATSEPHDLSRGPVYQRAGRSETPLGR